MTPSGPFLRWGSAFVRALLLVGAMLQATTSQAQTAITPSGLGTIVTPKGTTQEITGGTRSGPNLFHSFGIFSVGAKDAAKFVNTTPTLATTNIVGRITGGERSNVFGTIDTLSYPGANLFLINPAGVMFGPGAKLNVNGSVHVSTANYLRFADGAKFFANLSQNSVLTAASPAAFGFLGPTPTRISVEGSSLQVPAGKTLSLVGGEAPYPGQTETGLKITGPIPPGAPSTLGAPGGRIQILSVASAGEATLNPNVDVSSFSRLGQTNISNARIDVSGNARSGNSGGTVLIRGGRLVADKASIFANTSGTLRGAPLGIDLQVTEDIVLTDSTAIQATTSGSGSGGGLRITADKLQMDKLSRITSGTVGRNGSAGDVSVDVNDFSLNGGALISSTVGGAGPGGKVTVTARKSAVISGQGSGLVSNIASGSRGGGGQITISAPSLTLDDGGTIATRALTQTAGAQPGGDITVDVRSLTVKGGASINSRTIAPQGGNVTVKASDLAVISGQNSGILSGSSGAGGAGKISIDVGKLTLMGGGTIQSGSIQDRQGGDVTVKARDSIVISGGSRLSSQAFARDANPMVISAPSLIMDGGAIEGSTIGTGRAANISVTVDNLTLVGGAQIANSNAVSSSGAGGNLTVTATGPILISGRSNDGKPVSPFSKDPSSGLFSTASKSGTAPAGQITVSAPTLTLRDGGKISVATESVAAAGKAGDISLNVGNLTLASGARIDSSTSGAGRGGTETITAAGSVNISGGSGFFSNAAASGPGGNINIRAGQFQLTDGGTISAKSSGTGDAGSVTITAAKSFRSQNSVVTTEAIQAGGGSISFIGGPGSLVYLRKSEITTSVKSGNAKAGNITIDPQFVILDHSRIRADAFGGPGGNVRIVADVYLTTDSLVSASSALGVPGTVNIQASITNVSGSLARLPEAVLQAAALLRASCAARLAGGKSSSLVLGGRDSVPPEPGGLLPSPLLPAGPVDDRLSRSQGHRWETLPGFSRTVLDPMCSR